MVFGVSGLGKERKYYLERQRLITCGFCPYNRGENAKRRGRSDRHKDVERESIRKYFFVADLIEEEITMEGEA